VKRIAFGKLSWWEVSFPAGVRLFANFAHGVRAAEKLMLAVVSFESLIHFGAVTAALETLLHPKSGFFGELHSCAASRLETSGALRTD
jgi:hypothetical protein